MSDATKKNDILAADSTTADESQPSDQRWRTFVGNRMVTLTIVAGLPTILALGARWHWAIELLTHFCVYYALALAISGTICLLLGRRRTALFAGLALAWNVTLIVPLYFGGTGNASRPAGVATGKPLRGLTVNVLTHNDQKDEVLAYLREQDADFLFVMEVDDEWGAALEALKDEYPRHFIRWRGGAFGIAFFSRLPTESIDIEHIGEADIPTLLARLYAPNGQSFTLVGTHPLPPVGQENARLRNGQLTAVAERVTKLAGPVMLMGDLNITGWSPYFDDLLEASNLRDTRHGFGVQGTWAPFNFVPRLPIDHVLASEQFVVDIHRVGPDIGSDHRAVIVDFHLAPDSSQAAATR